MNTRFRFPPSPTGYLHIGNLRNALFNFLLAKKLKGKLILRVEDTDQKRQVEGSVGSLIDILNWIGINFDEGPHLGGEYGPYTQSERKGIYEKYIKELLDKNGAYYCFCASARLDKMREDQQAKKLPPRYDRLCRDLSQEEAEAKIKKGEKFVIRQKMPEDGVTIVKDELRGEIKFNNSELDDHILVKSSSCENPSLDIAHCSLNIGLPTYQFANVVDDYLMKISHVVRGDEWIASFPKNALLYRAFSWSLPKFIHLPLILNKKGGKLSKRDNDVSVEDYRSKGYLKEAIINFCALQGWHPKDDQETFGLKELREKFGLDGVGISPAIFDLEKLDYLNGWHIRQLDLDRLTELCIPFLIKAGILEEMTNDEWRMTNFKNKITGAEISFDFLKNIVRLEQERMKKLSEIGELTDFFFLEKLDYEADLLVWKKMTKELVKERLKEVYNALAKIPEENWTNNSIAEAMTSHIQAKNGKNGEYLWPMRASLTGKKASPSPFDAAEVLGKERSLKRVWEGINKLS